MEIFMLIKYKIQLLNIEGYSSYVWEKLSRGRGGKTISSKTARRLIKTYGLNRVFVSENGEVWEAEGCPYKSSRERAYSPRNQKEKD